VRGKAVSVSARGEELRVWELEAGLGRKNVVLERSVLVRNDHEVTGHADIELGGLMNRERPTNVPKSGAGCWVGFNDDVVVVLKEESEKGEKGEKGRALVVYDFT
jgi:hypothetical protein